MPIVSFLNIKGGVGKTSMTFHLAGALSALGRKVLVVDNDPQANLTNSFLGVSGSVSLDPSGTIVAIASGDDPLPEQVIMKTEVEGIDLIPGSDQLVKFCHADPAESSYELHVAFREFFAGIPGRYDYILIDCAPYLMLGACAALTASDYLIVPLKPQLYSVAGLVHVQNAMELIERGHNPDLKLLGYLPNLVGPRRAVHIEWIGEIRRVCGDQVFATMIPDLTDYEDAEQFRKTIVKYKPKSKAAKVMKEFAAEVEARLAAGANEAGGAEGSDTDTDQDKEAA